MKIAAAALPQWKNLTSRLFCLSKVTSCVCVLWWIPTRKPLLTVYFQGIMTILRDRTTCREEFIFHIDRLSTIIVEKALTLIPCEPKVVKTPNKNVYKGVSQTKVSNPSLRDSSVLIARRTLWGYPFSALVFHSLKVFVESSVMCLSVVYSSSPIPRLASHCY